MKILIESESYTKLISKGNFVRRFVCNEFINRVIPRLDTLSYDDKIELLQDGIPANRGTLIPKDAIVGPSNPLIQHHLSGIHVSGSNNAEATLTFYINIRDHTALHNRAFTYIKSDPKVETAFNTFYDDYSKINKTDRIGRAKFILDRIVPYIKKEKDYLKRLYKESLAKAVNEVIFKNKGDTYSVEFQQVNTDNEKPEFYVKFNNLSFNSLGEARKSLPYEFNLNLITDNGKQLTIKLSAKDMVKGIFKTDMNQYGDIKDILAKNNWNVIHVNDSNVKSGDGPRFGETISGKQVVGKDFSGNYVLQQLLGEPEKETTIAYKELLDYVYSKFKAQIDDALLKSNNDSDKAVRKLLNKFQKIFAKLDYTDLEAAVLDSLHGDLKHSKYANLGGDSYGFASTIRDKMNEDYLYDDNEDEYWSDYVNGWFIYSDGPDYVLEDPRDDDHFMVFNTKEEAIEAAKNMKY